MAESTVSAGIAGGSGDDDCGGATSAAFISESIALSAASFVISGNGDDDCDEGAEPLYSFNMLESSLLARSRVNAIEDAMGVGGENAWIVENPSDRIAIDGRDTRMVEAVQLSRERMVQLQDGNGVRDVVPMPDDAKNLCLFQLQQYYYYYLLEDENTTKRSASHNIPT